MANSSYRLWIRQVSNDGGQTWSNMEAHKVGDIIDYSSTCSGEPIYRWHLENINDRYDCDSETKTKYQISVYQVSMDNGDSWEDVIPLQIQRSGTTIPNSVDCGYIQYRWHESETETICDFQEHAKYKMLSYQYSKDGGSTWLEFVPREYKKGDLIEAKSVDCGYVIEYRWVAIDGDYECDSTTNNKYAVEKKQYSENGGQWYDVSPTETRRGSVIEEHSFDCGYTEYRWIVDDDDYDCDTTTHTKYQVEKKQYTTDGINWIDEGTTRRGDVIEYYSVDCGYVVQYRWAENGYDCDTTNYSTKHQYYKKQYSNDNGTTWLDVEPLETKVISTPFSEDCGYVPSVSGCKVRVIWANTEAINSDDYLNLDLEEDIVSFDDCNIPWQYFGKAHGFNGWEYYWDDDGGSSPFFDKSIYRVEIGDGITEILQWGFGYRKCLRSAIIPNSVTSMADGVFIQCSSLTNVTIDANLGSEMFSDCSSLSSVTIGNSVTSIGDSAFYQCTSLSSITIPNSVTSIGSMAFVRCTSLSNITIPNSVTSIGSSAFNGCSSLTSVIIPNSLTFINDAFSNCTSLTSVTIPDSVTYLDAWAFEGCTSLPSITIPNSVFSIGLEAFRYCTSLTSVTIPNSVTEIKYSAFYKCTSLTSVTIGNSVTSIGKEAFRYCTSLTNITYQGTMGQWSEIKRGTDWRKNTSITVVHCTDGDIHCSN